MGKTKSTIRPLAFRKSSLTHTADTARHHSPGFLIKWSMDLHPSLTNINLHARFTCMHTDEARHVGTTALMCSCSSSCTPAHQFEHPHKYLTFSIKPYSKLIEMGVAVYTEMHSFEASEGPCLQHQGNNLMAGGGACLPWRRRSSLGFTSGTDPAV
eukprot:635118-Pelagomonas_calceolata.AAC.3